MCFPFFCVFLNEKAFAQFTYTTQSTTKAAAQYTVDIGKREGRERVRHFVLFQLEFFFRFHLFRLSRRGRVQVPHGAFYMNIDLAISLCSRPHRCTIYKNVVCVCSDSNAWQKHIITNWESVKQVYIRVCVRCSSFLLLCHNHHYYHHHEFARDCNFILFWLFVSADPHTHPHAQFLGKLHGNIFSPLASTEKLIADVTMKAIFDDETTSNIYCSKRKPRRVAFRCVCVCPLVWCGH